MKQKHKGIMKYLRVRYPGHTRAELRRALRFRLRQMKKENKQQFKISNSAANPPLKITTQADR